jgi:hypothetical protein
MASLYHAEPPLLIKEIIIMLNEKIKIFYDLA